MYRFTQLSIILFFYTNLLLAQVNETTLYTSTDGLPYTECQNVTVDDQGYLWIITNTSELVRYDGKQFLVIDTRRQGIDYDYRFFAFDDAIWIMEKTNPVSELYRYKNGNWNRYNVDTLTILNDQYLNRIIGYNQEMEIYEFDQE